MDVSTRRGKSFASGYHNLLDKTGLAPNVKGDHRGIYSRVTHPRRGVTLNRGFCFAFLLGLAVVTQGQAEDYYIYQTAKGELVISNKQPPPGSKIIKQLPGVTTRKFAKPDTPVSRSQTYRRKARQSRPTTNKARATRAYIQSFK